MFVYHEAVSLLKLRPTLRTQLTLLYAGLLAVLGGALIVGLVPLRGTASVGVGPEAAAQQAALNAHIRNVEIIGAIALAVMVLLALAGGWLIAEGQHLFAGGPQVLRGRVRVGERHL